MNDVKHGELAEESRTARRKKWRRFSLGTLLSLVTITALGLGWVANEARRARKEERAVLRLGQVVGKQADGGKPVSGQLNVDFGKRFGASEFRDIRVLVPEPKGMEKWIAEWLGESFLLTVRGLRIYGVGNNFQPGTDQLGQYEPNATYVSGLFDKDASLLKDLPNIDTLMLEANPIGDDGVQQLKGLKRLKHLNLSNSQITDESASVIASLPNLKTLNVSRTIVGDDFVKALLRKLKLQSLNLRSTRVSDEIVEEISRKWPDCEVEFK